MVDVETVEVEAGIHIVVTIGQILLPVAVGGIHEVDVALPARRQRMLVLVVVGVGVDAPLRIDAILRGIVEGTIAKVVEHGLYAEGVLLGDVLLDDACIDFAVGDVGICLHQLVSCAA